MVEFVCLFMVRNGSFCVTFETSVRPWACVLYEVASSVFLVVVACIVCDQRGVFMRSVSFAIAPLSLPRSVVVPFQHWFGARTYSEQLYSNAYIPEHARGGAYLEIKSPPERRLHSHTTHTYTHTQCTRQCGQHSAQHSHALYSFIVLVEGIHPSSARHPRYLSDTAFGALHGLM